MQIFKNESRLSTFSGPVVVLIKDDKIIVLPAFQKSVPDFVSAMPCHAMPQKRWEMLGVYFKDSLFLVMIVSEFVGGCSPQIYHASAFRA